MRVANLVLASHFLLLTSLGVPLASVSCVKTVDNTIDDAMITARVETALLNDPEIGVLKIDVESANGIVTVSGTVRSAEQAARAVALARQAAGVRDVKSGLQVAPPTSQS